MMAGEGDVVGTVKSSLLRGSNHRRVDREGAAEGRCCRRGEVIATNAAWRGTMSRVQRAKWGGRGEVPGRTQKGAAGRGRWQGAEGPRVERGDVAGIAQRGAIGEQSRSARGRRAGV